ncbi:dolichyldiphosphatase 1-like protein [Cladochytrium replicatum]|nr:dolichyldiphosphatase 1-like protein [Cladochytrium replicatum]
MGLKAITLTFVQYDAEDPLGKLLAYASLVPIALIVSYITLIAFRRDVATIVFFAGQILNEAFNAVLKAVIREPRPTDYLGHGYGMPSSHSQFMAFFAVYGILYICLRTSADSPVWKLLYSIALSIVALCVGYSRIHLHYHTASQVVVGLSVGVFFALFWFLLADRLLFPILCGDSSQRKPGTRGIIAHPVAQLFLIRDTRGIPNVLRWEYNRVVTASSTSEREPLKSIEEHSDDDGIHSLGYDADGEEADTDRDVRKSTSNSRLRRRLDK